MLLVVRDIAGIKYSQLMDVYAEDLHRSAKKDYPHLPCNEALFCAEQDLYAYLRDAFFKTENAYCAFWVEGARYCSALRMEPYEDGFLICGISTDPQHRRKGYGAKLLKQVLEQVFAGTSVYSHIEKNNAPSIRLHTKCGFECLADGANMLDGSFLHNFLTFIYRK